MKHYLGFVILIILLIFSYTVSPYFSYNGFLSVPSISTVNLPVLTKAGQDTKSDININAFMKKNMYLTSSVSYSKKRQVTLEMIYFDGNSKMCKLNGAYFKEGESHSGIKVLKIKKKSVLIKVNKKIERLNLGVMVNEKD